MRRIWLFLVAVTFTLCVNFSPAATQEEAWDALNDVEYHMFSLHETHDDGELGYFAQLNEDFYILAIDLWEAVDMGMDPETADLVATYVIDAGNSLTNSAQALADLQGSLIEAKENGYDVAVQEYFNDNFQQSLDASQYAETELANGDQYWQTFIDENLDAQMLLDEGNDIIINWYSGGGGGD